MWHKMSKTNASNCIFFKYVFQIRFKKKRSLPAMMKLKIIELPMGLLCIP